MRCWSNPIPLAGGNLCSDGIHRADRNPLEDRIGSPTMPDLFTLAHATRVPQSKDPGA